MTRGLPASKKTAVLNTPANMLWDVMYYDDLGRNIKTYKQHYLGGVIDTANYDLVKTTYDFTNAPTTTTRQHWNATNKVCPIVTVANKYLYDHMGRKLKTWEQLKNTTLAPDANKLVSQTDYNEIGQVQRKRLHSTDSTSFLQTIAYAYNERGWLLSSSAPLFEMQLQYNTSTITGVTPTAQFNGNIASQSWGTAASPNTSSTVYLYDPINRLLSGTATTGNTESGIAYDNMGNITALARYQAGGTPIDNLAYSYTSGTNQLHTVADAVGGTTGGIPTGTTTYLYDGNGNMLSAANTGSAGKNKSFTYNLLNLPLVATYPTGTATYTYDAAGTKLRKVDLVSGVSTNTDYIGGIQYGGTGTETISFIQTEEGRALPNGTTAYNYQYYLGDNLGNTRITFDTGSGSASKIQQDDYYPFGMEILTGSPANPKNDYLYNKKELQEEFGEEDYGARFYDPVIGRWTSVDTKAEKSRRFSPYTYADDNPIRFIDPDGMETTSVHVDKYGTVLKNVNDGDNHVYEHDNAKTTKDIDKTYSKTNTGAGGKDIGELGGKINANNIIKNILDKNMPFAKGITNPFTFKSLVQKGGDWDFKNSNSNRSTVFDVAERFKLNGGAETQFQFGKLSMSAEDFGNFHYGAVGTQTYFGSDYRLLHEAGLAQIADGTSRIEWSGHMGTRPPYGDDPKDQEWIKIGITYGKENNK